MGTSQASRPVEIPGRAVTIVRGAAVLAVPKEAAELLPGADDLATPINRGNFTLSRRLA
jgi:hypothetical protein